MIEFPTPLFAAFLEPQKLTKSIQRFEVFYKVTENPSKYQLQKKDFNGNEEEKG